jgi:hypothetical protein
MAEDSESSGVVEIVSQQSAPPQPDVDHTRCGVCNAKLNSINRGEGQGKRSRYCFVHQRESLFWKHELKPYGV